LKDKGVWAIDKAEPWSVVKKRCGNKKIHIGSLLEPCYEKGSELEETDSRRKFKGRVVFLGDRV
jgi:hypothetical protein